MKKEKIFKNDKYGIHLIASRILQPQIYELFQQK